MLDCNGSWLNGVLRRFQQYFSHITATVHIIHVFPGFSSTGTRLGLLSVLPKDPPMKKTQRIQCRSNPGPLDNESNTLPLSHAGPPCNISILSSRTNWSFWLKCWSLALTLNSIDTHCNTLTTDFWKHCGKRRIARSKQFLLFPQCFLLNQKLVSPFVNIYGIISLFAAELEEPKIGISGKGLTLYRTIQTFNDPERGLLKTLWVKDKMLIISILSFSHIVFYPSWNKFQPFHSKLFCGLQMLSVWTRLKFCRWVKS